MFVLCYFIQVLLSGVSWTMKGYISILALRLVRIALKLRRFRKLTFIGVKLGASCTTDSPSSKYVVYATACVYRELYGKIADLIIFA